MKNKRHKKIGRLLACAAGSGAVLLGLFGLRRRAKRKAADRTDYSDAHHLRFCDETYLSRRLLPFDSAINMRDIGGYTNGRGEQTRWGKIYRGEELCHLSETDKEKMNALGITHVFDFRDAEKTKRMPDWVPQGARYINIPVLKGLKSGVSDYTEPGAIDRHMRAIYELQVREKAANYARILKTLADDPDAVIYIHCTNGKDRTGFMTALILLLAGVPEETILSDYSLTNLTFDKAFATLGTILAQDLNQSDKEKLRDFFGVDPDWLKLQLDYIRENYGTVDSYLTENTDLTPEDLRRARANILEKAPEVYAL